MSDRESLDDQPQSKSSQMKRSDRAFSISFLFPLFSYCLDLAVAMPRGITSNGWKRNTDRTANILFFSMIFAYGSRFLVWHDTFMCMLNLKESKCSWSLTNDKPSRFHSTRSRGWCVLIAGMWCAMNPFASACMHNYRPASPWPVLSNVARKESLFFNGIQDSRWPAACRSRKDSPFRPLHVLLSCSFDREPLLSSSLYTMRHASAYIGTRAHTHTHATYTRARVCVSNVFSLALLCRYLQLLTLPCVAMLILFYSR